MDIYYKEFFTVEESDDYLTGCHPDYYMRTVLEDKRVIITALIYDETICPMLSFETIAAHIEKCHWKRLAAIGD